MRREWQVGHVYIVSDLQQARVVTHWPDGLKLVACPHFDESYRRTADRCGYGTDDFACVSLNAEHDLIHSCVSAWVFRQPWSPTLRAAAEGGPRYRHADAEESFVLWIQRSLNYPALPAYRNFWLGEWTLWDLRRRLIEELRG